MVDKHTFLKVDQLKIHRMGKLVVDIPIPERRTGRCPCCRWTKWGWKKYFFVGPGWFDQTHFREYFYRAEFQ